jgi:hypothetical protein
MISEQINKGSSISERRYDRFSAQNGKDLSQTLELLGHGGEDDREKQYLKEKVNCIMMIDRLVFSPQSAEALYKLRVFAYKSRTWRTGIKLQF